MVHDVSPPYVDTLYKRGTNNYITIVDRKVEKYEKNIAWNEWRSR